MIDPQLFVTQAVNLPVGQSMRGDHDCIGGSDGTLMINRESDKLTAYCFRCGERGYVAEQESMSDRIQRLTQEREATRGAQASMELPEPRVYTLSEWPRDAGLWLYLSGFSPSMIEKLGAYWCPSLGRVVLPVMEGDKAVFWQARSTSRLPKVISPRTPRQGIVARYGKGDTLVLCEDMLSAYKVGQVTEAWSLLGTKLPTSVAAEILERDSPVVVWLDSDVPGQDGATTILGTLRAYGVTVRNVVTIKDPKAYSRGYIEGVLHEHRY